MKTLPSNIRQRLFKLYDFINGSPIKYNLKEIRSHFANIDKNNNLEDSPIKKVLVHATKTTAYYKNLRNFKSIKDFPVVNKTIIKNSLNDFISNSYNPKDLIPIITSGSTGTPFLIYHDKRKKYRNYADTLFFNALAGYEIGHQLIYLKIWAKEKLESNLYYKLRNFIPVDVLELPDEKIKELIQKIDNYKGFTSILGYASAQEQICKYLDKVNHPSMLGKVKSIIATSEALSDYTKSRMQYYFGVPALSRYSNLENGIMASQELTDRNSFLVNSASYFIELLKLDSDEPVGEGEMGRIVVTDLYNYATLMIRYDTGDVGIEVNKEHLSNKRYLAHIEGRKLDILFNTKGELISSFIAYKHMWKYKEIDQYQLVQETEKDFTFKINTKEFKRTDQLLSELKLFLGQDANIVIEFVDEIPLLSSGKRRKVINNYLKRKENV